MDITQIKQILSALGWKYNREALAYLENELCETDLSTNSAINRLQKYFQYQPKPVQIVQFFNSKQSQSDDKCPYCQNTKTIGVPHYQIIRNPQSGEFLSLPGPAIDCPECVGTEALQKYFHKAHFVDYYEIEVRRPNHPPKLVKKSMTQLEADELLNAYQNEDYSYEIKICHPVLQTMTDRMKWDNKYPFDKWMTVPSTKITEF